MEILHNQPSLSDFTSLSVHQSQTPASFYDGPAVLHHHSPSCSIQLSRRDLDLAPAFTQLAAGGRTVNGGTTANGNHEDTEEQEAEVQIPSVDIYITSERFILFSSDLKTGLSLTYPSISLHALQRPSSIYLQLSPSTTSTETPFDDHDPDASISLTITPQVMNPAPGSDDQPDGTHTAPQTNEEQEPIDLEERSQDEPTNLFNALSACANLHPDPPLPGDEDDDGGDQDDDHPALINGFAANESSGIDGLPPPIPGSGGWITAENAGQFFDEEGSFVGRPGQTAIGGGAGRVRRREEQEDTEDMISSDGDHMGNGESRESAETKWRRTG